MRKSTTRYAVPLFVWLALFTLDANAAITGSGVFDTILAKYQSAATGWAGYITGRASWLFWALATISMVWTFGMLSLRKADIAEFFAELFKFTVFTGFFWWLLTNGPKFATSIYASMRQIGSSAGGLSNTLSPSGIVDIGFLIFNAAMDNIALMNPIDSLIGVLFSGAILVILALVGVNMLLLLVSGWMLAYAGVFFLGFGGSRWTSDMAINYYKTVLGVGIQLMTMVLLVGIGKTFVDDYYNQMSAGLTSKELGVMVVVAVILLMLVNKVPGLISGVINGSGLSHSGIGNFGAGAALGAAGMAAAAAATGGAMVAAGAANIAGGASAIMSAVAKASQNVSAGTDVMSNMMGGGSSSSSSGGSAFAASAGQGGGSSGNSSSSDQRTGQSGQSGGFLASAGKIAADTVANLASGTASVAKEKAGAAFDAARDRISETTGGKIASAIDAMGTSDGPSFSGDSLGGETADVAEEVSAFANRARA